MNCVIYARVSSKEQEREGFSIPAQLKLLREYAAKHRFKVAEEYTDVETAKKTGRTSFGQMLSYLRSNGVSCRTILVEKTDRLYRNIKDWVTLDELDVQVHFVKENFILSKDSKSTEKFLHGIKVLMAKNYIDNLSEEVKKGLDEKANQGIYPCGKLPLGYIRNRVTGEIELDPERVDLVKRLFEEFATSQLSVTSAHQLAKDLTLTYRRSGLPISRSETERLLKRIFYTGRFLWRGIVLQGSHPAIVDDSLFQRVQKVFKDRCKPVFKAKEFAYSRLLTCGNCGCMITADIKKGKYTYYFCTNHHGRCNRQYIREEILADKLAELVRAVQINEDLRDWLGTVIERNLKEKRKKTNVEKAKLEARASRIRTLMDKAYIDKLEGQIPEEYWLQKSEEWRNELSLIDSRIERLKEDVPENYELGRKAIELANRAYPLYIRQNATERRRLLNTLLSNCSIYNGTLCPTYRKPFDILAKRWSIANKRRDWDSNPGGA